MSAIAIVGIGAGADTAEFAAARFGQISRTPRAPLPEADLPALPPALRRAAADALNGVRIDGARMELADLGSGCRRLEACAADVLLVADSDVVLVLKRPADAERDDDRMIALLDDVVDGAGRLGEVAAAAFACHFRALPGSGNPWLEDGRPRAVSLPSGTVREHPGRRLLPPWLRMPRLRSYRGSHRAEVEAALRQGKEGGSGPAALVIAADDDADFERKKSAFLAGHPTAGAAFCAAPMAGEIAFVFSGPAGATNGMARDLVLAWPRLLDGLSDRFQALRTAAGWLYADAPPTESDKVWGASFVSQIHAELMRALGMRPHAAIGLCSGESNSLFALGAWRDMDALYAEAAEEGVFTRRIGGAFEVVREAWGTDPVAWSSWHVLADEAALRTALAAEPRVHLAIINAPGSFVISGDTAGCRRVIERVGALRARPLNYDLAVHCPEMVGYADNWWRLHYRRTYPVPGVRFYTHATGRCYEATADFAAQALLGQALRTVNFPALIERAYADGVRTFVELGPQGSCSRWIGEILGTRPHLSVALDRPGVSSLTQAFEAVAWLLAAGHDLDLSGLEVQTMSPPATRRAEQPPLLAGQARFLERMGEAVAHHAAAHQAWMQASTRAYAAFLTAARRTETPPVRFSRADLEVHASGRISALFGPRFEQQDAWPRQVRMPQPPMLLVDRVVSLEATPGVLGRGRIRTQTDVTADAWYLHCGRMPAGIFIETGQADLLLVSWMGADFSNRGERVYRLLGCDLRYHGALPAAGDTISHDIRIDGHAGHLFSFHNDGRIGDRQRISIDGHAGFFTDEELAGSQGVLWSPGPFEAKGRGYSPEEVRAFAAGRPWECFGASHDAARVHVRTPRIQDGRMQILEAVTVLDPDGGPEGKGYLRAETAVHADDWFFAGHFKNDPCMPGTLMFEGCLQAMSFYLAAQGVTLDRDGWRFEPVPDETYRLRCRGQVVPTSRRITYEVFVRSFDAGPIPTLFADVLCSVDGLKAFHAERMGWRLVPDFPLGSVFERGGHAAWFLAAAEADRWLAPDARPCAEWECFHFDAASILACAWGIPSRAFGPRFAVFEGIRRTPRLPGPPYLFVSRIARVENAAMGVARPGAVVEAEYDIPEDAWYFAEGGGEMPFCVLMEAALQPCGWLATFLGITLRSTEDLFYRNLDGEGTVRVRVRPGQVLTTRVTCTGISSAAGTVIESFDVACFLGDLEVYRMRTVFGHFPRAALATQAGLPEPVDAAWEARPANVCRDFGRSGRLALLDRVTGFWPEEGRLRAEMDVDPGAWFFKSHFFQDPVQPGSLGIEAMLQALQAFMLMSGMQEGMRAPRFEAVALDAPIAWKYRGQVLPTSRRVVITLQVTSVERRAGEVLAVAEAYLTVDGTRIYHAARLPVRLVDDDVGIPGELEAVDPAREPWLRDHCPAFVPEIPVLPLAAVLERFAAAARRPGQVLIGMDEVVMERWVVFPDGARSLRTQISPAGELLLRDGEAVAARGRARTAPAYPPPPPALPPLTEGEEVDPYAEDGALFHGPFYRRVTGVRRSTDATSSEIEAGGARIPPGELNAVLFDCALHGIPHDQSETWFPEVPPGRIAYPRRIRSLRLYGPPPTVGRVRCEVRAHGTLTARVQLQIEGRVWAEAMIEAVAVDVGPLAARPPVERVAFLRDRRFVPGMGLSAARDGVTTLRFADVRAAQWLPGALEAVYAAGEPARLAVEVAVKEHVARKVGVHPNTVVEGRARRMPLTIFPMDVESGADSIQIRDAGPPRLDIALLRSVWIERYGASLFQDLLEALTRQFVAALEVDATPSSGPVLYLANHEVQVESALFGYVVGAWSGVPVAVLACLEQHREDPGYWLAPLIEGIQERLGPESPRFVTYHDDWVAGGTPLPPGQSLLVHADGLRKRSSAERVETLSSALLDLALGAEMPVVPVWIRGGLPLAPLEKTLDFPIGFGRQTFRIGAPIPPGMLRAWPYGERRKRVLDAINALAPVGDVSGPPDPGFAGGTDFRSVLRAALARLDEPSPETVDLLQGRPSSDFGRWLAASP